MEYIVTVYFYDIHGENCTSYMWTFDNETDALQFANTVTDNFLGIERLDVSISWKLNEK